MNTHLLALQLMAAQGLLGAFDTVYHHELTEALPGRPTARNELAIHAARALIYALLFIGLAAWEWHGGWAIALFILFGIEIVLTLWDFVTEDRTRLLPATERVTHTILAINGGAFIALLALDMPQWLYAPTQLAWMPHGLLSGFLIACGTGVGLSGVRDGWAALRLTALRGKPSCRPPLRFGDRPEHVLVTGATGFIGQELVHALLANGHQVTILTRRPKHAAWMFDGKVRCIAAMGELPPNRHVDVIVNLAGARILGLPWTRARRSELRASRIGLTAGLVRWIATASCKPRLLLSASAIGYYGIQKTGDDSQLVEDSPPQPIFMSELCSEWEDAARQAAPHGVPVRCMRFGLVLGRLGALPMMLLPIRIGLGGRLGSGRQWFSWIHLHDLLRGIAHLWNTDSQTEMTAAYNFTAPDAVTQGEFSRTAAAVLHRPALFAVPAAPMRLLLGQQADLLLEGQRVVPERLRREGFSFAYPRLDAALEDLA